MARVLIVGCGDIGLGLAKVLISEGHLVSAIKRKPLVEDLPGLTLILADITVANELVSLPTDFDQIYVILTPNNRDEESYRRVFEKGIDNLLDHFASDTDNRAQASGKKSEPGQHNFTPHWIFVSSTSVYGQNAGEWVDEESPTEPTGFNGKALWQAEQRILATGSNNTIVRFSGIYGPGRNGLLKRIESGVQIQYSPPYYTNRIHRDDCIGVLAWLLGRRLAGKRMANIYMASDNEPAPIKEVAQWLADKLDSPNPPVREIMAVNPGQNKRCSNKRLGNLGYSFLFKSYREGYSELI